MGTTAFTVIGIYRTLLKFVLVFLKGLLSSEMNQLNQLFILVCSVDCAVPENIHTPPTEDFLFSTPLPQGNFSLFPYITSKNLALKTPLPLGISNDLPWDGYGFFLEPHIVNVK